MDDPVIDLRHTDLRMSEVVRIAERIAASGTPVYIDGDSGWLMAGREGL